MLNKKNDFEEIFKEEFKKVHTVDINVTDIILEDRLTSKKQVSVFWKYATAFTTFLLIISTCIFSIGLNNQKGDFFGDVTFKYIHIEDDSEILKEEDINKMLKLCAGEYYRNSAYYIDITKDISLYIYKGITKNRFIDSGVGEDLDYQTIYFYAFKFKDKTKCFNLLIDGVVININSENNFGILGYVFPNEEISIEFDIVYNNRKKSYNFMETK